MKKYGFNMLWMFISRDETPAQADERQLDFIAGQGFNFIRIPMDYRFWTKDFQYTKPDERVLSCIDGYIEACAKRNLHVCLNLHRAPGYCINNNDREKHNLWTDEQALDGFRFLWQYFASKYKGIPSDKLSFDLLNEPPLVGQYGFTRQAHERVMRDVVAAIREIDPSRDIVLDGISCGAEAIPELADLGVIHSGRGYMPFHISHNQANWCGIDQWDTPVYPGTTGGAYWDRDALIAHYQPWRDVEAKGVEIHIGEFGCYNKTPNDVALRWLNDLMGVYRAFGWGFSMWNFDGPFGIVNHGRPGARYVEMDGFLVDADLLDCMKRNMIT